MTTTPDPKVNEQAEERKPRIGRDLRERVNRHFRRDQHQCGSVCIHSRAPAALQRQGSHRRHDGYRWSREDGRAAVVVTGDDGGVRGSAGGAMTDVITPLSEEEIAELRRLTGVMTPAPWETSAHSFPTTRCTAGCYEGDLENEWGIYPPLGEAGPVTLVPGEADARGITALRNAAPRLFATLAHERERAERAEADVAIRDEKLRSANRQIVEHAECVGELEYAHENRHLHAERSTYAARIAELESALQSSEEERKRHKARLLGEAARMDDAPITANPFGQFDHERDDSPEASIAAEWEYGWRYQNCIEAHGQSAGVLTDEGAAKAARECLFHLINEFTASLAEQGWRVTKIYDPEPFIAEFLTIIKSHRSPDEGYRPMETAPKDGREVLLLVKLRAGIRGRQLVGHYLPGGFTIEDHPAIAGGWYFWNGCMFDRAAEPIGWAPLPVIPESHRSPAKTETPA